MSFSQSPRSHSSHSLPGEFENAAVSPSHLRDFLLKKLSPSHFRDFLLQKLRSDEENEEMGLHFSMMAREHPVSIHIANASDSV